MFAGGAFRRGFFADIDISAVAADPDDFVAVFENNVLIQGV